MKIRGDTSRVGEGSDKDHALLAAFLEATSRIDRRAGHRSVALPEVPNEVDLRPVNLQPVNLEAEPASHEAGAVSPHAAEISLEVQPTSLDLASADPNVRVAAAPFTFRRANLVRA